MNYLKSQKGIASYNILLIFSFFILMLTGLTGFILTNTSGIYTRFTYMQERVNGISATERAISYLKENISYIKDSPFADLGNNVKIEVDHNILKTESLNIVSNTPAKQTYQFRVYSSKPVDLYFTTPSTQFYVRIYSSKQELYPRTLNVSGATLHFSPEQFYNTANEASVNYYGLYTLEIEPISTTEVPLVTLNHQEVDSNFIWLNVYDNSGKAEFKRYIKVQNQYGLKNTVEILK